MDNNFKQYNNLDEIIRAALAYAEENWVPGPEDLSVSESRVCYDMQAAPDMEEERICYGSGPRPEAPKGKRKKTARDVPEESLTWEEDSFCSMEPCSTPIAPEPAEKLPGMKSRYGDRYDPNRINTVMRKHMSGDIATGMGRALNQAIDLTFSEKLATVISERDLRDVDVYKAAHMDRKLFSKIINDRYYTPSRDTVLALAIALKMGLKDANDLLQRAGFAISHSSHRDLEIEFFLREGIFDLGIINETLYETGEKIIGKS